VLWLHDRARRLSVFPEELDHACVADDRRPIISRRESVRHREQGIIGARVVVHRAAREPRTLETGLARDRLRCVECEVPARPTHRHELVYQESRAQLQFPHASAPGR